MENYVATVSFVISCSVDLVSPMINLISIKWNDLFEDVKCCFL